MEAAWKHSSIFLLLLFLLLLLQPTASLQRLPADSSSDKQRNERMKNEESLDDSERHFRLHQRKLLQTAAAALPLPPLQVWSGGRVCVLFQVRKLSLRYEKQKLLDLTEKVFRAQKLIDLSQSVCHRDRATLVLSFGDVEDVRGLTIRLQLSSSFYESSAQWWFSLDGVSLLYDSSEEVWFNVSEVYAPTSSSYRCNHVSSLQRYSGLLLPASEHARRWSITFTDFQIQAFNVTSGRFSAASDCEAFLTPAILMGLVTSLILLLVLAYALHMLLHLKHIEHDDRHKAEGYYPQSGEELEPCWEDATEDRKCPAE